MWRKMPLPALGREAIWCLAEKPVTAKKLNLLRSGGLVSAMTLLSRILGFVRDQVFAYTFGAGSLTDAFLVAFKIPNFLRRLFAEGAFAQSFVPVFSEYKETRSKESLVQLASMVSGTLGLIVLTLSIIGSVFAPALIALFAPGFEDGGERARTATQLLRITFPYLFFISLVAYCGSVLNTFQRFAVPAFTPVLLNVCLIIAALWGVQFFQVSVTALAWGVFVAGMAQLMFQLPSMVRLGLLPLPKWGWSDSGVQKILKLMLPAIFGSSVGQLNLLLDTIIASFLVAGSVSWLYFADRLVEFPLGIFGIAIATVILPRLSSAHTTNQLSDFNRTLSWGFQLGVLLALPCAAGLLLLAAPLIATLFGYGEFEPQDTQMSAWALRAYALALPGLVLVKIFAPGFFARQNTRTPVRIGVIAMISNMVYNIILVGTMLLAALPGPHVGLALATALSANQNAVMLYRRLRQDQIFILGPTDHVTVKRAAIATAVMALVILAINPDTDVWLSMHAIERASHLAGIIAVAVLAYTITLFVTGFRPGAFRV